MVMTGYAANCLSIDKRFLEHENIEERTGLSGNLLARATDITEEEGI